MTQIRTPLDIGLVIRDRRRRLRLSQMDLARKVGVGRQWIVAVEQGRPRAELGLVLRTLAALDLALTLDSDRHPALADYTADSDAMIAALDDIAPVDIDAVVAAAMKTDP